VLDRSALATDNGCKALRHLSHKPIDSLESQIAAHFLDHIAKFSPIRERQKPGPTRTLMNYQK
jgi:hypothetical protein